MKLCVARSYSRFLTPFFSKTPKAYVNAVDDRAYYQEMQDWLLYMTSYQTRTIRMIQDAYVVKAMDAVLGSSPLSVLICFCQYGDVTCVR